VEPVDSEEQTESTPDAAAPQGATAPLQ
jgi:hypothetical protein